MRKVAYIIPAYTEYQHGRVYKKISNLFKARGITPILVSISWRGKKTMTDYINQFTKQYNSEKRKGDRVYLFGFSFGAFISFVSATKIKPKSVILCSLSPYFTEDTKYLKKAWIKLMGKSKMMDFRNYKFNELVKKFKSEAFILVGSKEDKKALLRRAEIAHEMIKGNKLIIIEKATHNIREKRYFSAIKLVIGSLE